MKRFSLFTVIVLFVIINQFSIQGQTLDATFSSPDSSQCIGSNYVLLANDTSFLSYDWNIEGPNNFSWNSNGVYYYTSLILNEAGYYNVSLTVSNGITTETITIPSFFYVNPIPLPTISTSNNLVVCADDSVLLSASGDAVNYVWNDSIPNNTFVSNSAGIYIFNVQAFNELGCINNLSVSIDFLAPPFSIIGSNINSGCSPLEVEFSQNSISLSGIGIEAYEYTFSDDNTVVLTNNPDSIVTHTFNLNGINYVSLKTTDSLGCIGTSAILPITIDNIPCSDTIEFFDNVFQDSIITGYLSMEWTDNCTFDYSDIIGTTIDSYQILGDSLIVNWLVQLNNSDLIPIEVTYLFAPGTTGVYEITLYLYCLNKSVTRFLSSTTRLYIENATNNLQTNEFAKIQLSPNPANSTISVSGLDERFKYEIRDLQGKLVLQGYSTNVIQIENLTTGAYFISVLSESGKNQSRFVKL